MVGWLHIMLIKEIKEKKLKQFSRAELLELLLAQTKEIERLKKELETTEQLLADKNLHMQKAGDLAHAVLQVNGVMEAAQAAAQQYLDNMVQMELETKQRCQKLIEEAMQKAEQIQSEGVSENIVQEAESKTEISEEQ